MTTKPLKKGATYDGQRRTPPFGAKIRFHLVDAVLEPGVRILPQTLRSIRMSTEARIVARHRTS